MSSDVKKMSDEEVLERIIELGFAGDQTRFEDFCTKLRAGLPPKTGVALRGSVVTNERWKDGEAFDASGPGTSDLDVTLIGHAVMECWEAESFYIPKLHTKPLSDKDPHCAIVLNGLRQELQALVGRPVNFQATNDLVLFARDVLLDQPYFKLLEVEEAAENELEENDISAAAKVNQDELDKPSIDTAKAV